MPSALFAADEEIRARPATSNGRKREREGSCRREVRIPSIVEKDRMGETASLMARASGRGSGHGRGVGADLNSAYEAAVVDGEMVLLRREDRQTLRNDQVRCGPDEMMRRIQGSNGLGDPADRNRVWERRRKRRTRSQRADLACRAQ